MRNKGYFAGLIASLGMLIALVLTAGFFSSPANAKVSHWFGAGSPSSVVTTGDEQLNGWITHYSPNQGYDEPIVIFCNYDQAFDEPGGRENWQPHHTSASDWDTRKLLYEGADSRDKCNGDTDVVWVRSGEEITCRVWRSYVGGGEYQWVKMFDLQGPHKIDGLFGHACVTGAD